MKSVSPDRVPLAGDAVPRTRQEDWALWSPTEVSIQAAQVRGQLDIWEALECSCPPSGFLYDLCDAL